MERNTERSFSPVAVFAAILLLMLPVLYLLPLGPLIWLDSSGRMEISEDSWIAKAYLPLLYVCENCPPLDTAFMAYVELWEAKRPTPPLNTRPPVPVAPPMPSLPAPVPMPTPPPLAENVVE